MKKNEVAKWKGRLVAVRNSITELQRAELHAIRRVEQEERKAGIGMKRLLKVWAVIGLLFLSGCATMSGLGEDITAISNGLAKSAVEHGK